MIESSHVLYPTVFTMRFMFVMCTVSLDRCLVDLLADEVLFSYNNKVLMENDVI